MRSLGIVNSSAPYGTSNGQESLDLALATASFGQEVSFFFISDGVFQLLQNQQPNSIESKNYSKTFAALEFYDIENIYVCAKSLLDRGISEQDLCIEVTILEQVEIHHFLTQQDGILSF